MGLEGMLIKQRSLKENRSGQVKRKEIDATVLTDWFISIFQPRDIDISAKTFNFEYFFLNHYAMKALLSKCCEEDMF